MLKPETKVIIDTEYTVKPLPGVVIGYTTLPGIFSTEYHPAYIIRLDKPDKLIDCGLTIKDMIVATEWVFPTG